MKKECLNFRLPLSLWTVLFTCSWRQCQMIRTQKDSSSMSWNMYATKHVFRSFSESCLTINFCTTHRQYKGQCSMVVRIDGTIHQFPMFEALFRCMVIAIVVLIIACLLSVSRTCHSMSVHGSLLICLARKDCHQKSANWRHMCPHLLMPLIKCQGCSVFNAVYWYTVWHIFSLSSSTQTESVLPFATQPSVCINSMFIFH